MSFNIFKQISSFFGKLFGGSETSSAESKSKRRRERRKRSQERKNDEARTATVMLPMEPRKTEQRIRTVKPQKEVKPAKTSRPPLEHCAYGMDKPTKEPRPAKNPKPTSEFHGNERKGELFERPEYDTGWTAPAIAEREEGQVYFQDLNLDGRILQALLKHMGFVKCSPIQGQALPLTLAGQDLAGRAQTGTGKTAAFLITILQYFLTRDDKASRDGWQPLAIILAPTRELALQIADDAAHLSVFCPDFKTVAVFGGMDYDRQMSALSHGVDLVVATPGRLLDYLRKHAVDLKAVKLAVIDEADRMLDMGFIPDVRRIMGYMNEPAERQTMLFSATLSHDIMQLAAQWMRPDPKVVEIQPEHVLAEGIQETVYSATTAEKIPIILWLYAYEDCRRVLIFRNRKRDVETLAETLKKCGIPCEMLSGDVEQKKRLRILDDFREGRLKTIVATDVAGRGIHVDDVTHVINFDLPYEGEDYVHRVGRTARAGHQGRAISFADEDSSFVIPEIEKIIERPLAITAPEEEMLKVPDKLKNLTYTRSTCAHRTEHNGGSGHFHRRTNYTTGRH